MNAIDDLIDTPQLSAVTLPGGTSQLKLDGTGIDEKHEGLIILPTSGFVIKTKSLHQSTNAIEDKLFINVCYHDALEQPATKKKLDDNGKEVEGLNLPLSMGPIRKCSDKAGNECMVVDAIIHPSVQDDMEEDKTGSKRDFVCQVLMQCFDQKYKDFAPLDQKYKLPMVKYFGYVDVRTGQVARKMSEDTEVCKQFVRDTRSKPKIEEVVGSLPKTESSIGKSSTKDGHKVPAPDLSPLSFNVSVQLSNGTEMTMHEFLDAIKNVAKDEHDLKILNSIWDGSLPLLINPDAYPESTVARVILKTTVTKLDWSSTNIHVSAFALHASSSSFGRSNCILPFCVDSQNVVCIYNQETSEMSISAAVLATSMCDGADVGSQPWLLAKALSVDKMEPNTAHTRIRNEKESKDRGAELITCIEGLDPYQLQSPFPWKRSNETNKQTEKKMDLAEDRFHMKDSISQYMMQQQDEERKEKIGKSEKERQERKSDGSMEYVSAQDFKRGGKYHEEGGLEDDNDDDEQKMFVKKAETMLKSCGTTTFKNEFWYKLL